MTFAIFYTPGPDWLPGKPLAEQPLEAHVAYLKGLHEQGQVHMGGPYADGSGGLVIAEVDHLDSALAIVAEDPAIRSGILAANVQQWNRIV
jgi:uncharacterized protein YciI